MEFIRYIFRNYSV